MIDSNKFDSDLGAKKDKVTVIKKQTKAEVKEIVDKIDDSVGEYFANLLYMRYAIA